MPRHDLSDEKLCRAEPLDGHLSFTYAGTVDIGIEAYSTMSRLDKALLDWRDEIA